MPSRRLLAPAALVLALAVAGPLYAATLVPRPASAAAVEPSDAGVSVSGVGTASATPDVVWASLGAEATAADHTLDNARARVAAEITLAYLDALEAQTMVELRRAEGLAREAERQAVAARFAPLRALAELQRASGAPVLPFTF